MWFDVQHLKMIQNSCELHLQAILIAGIAEKVLCTSLYFQISYLTAASHHNCFLSVVDYWQGYAVAF